MLVSRQDSKQSATEAGWLLDSRQVARLLGIGRTKAYELMARGEIPIVRIGRCVRAPRAALAAWVEKQTAAAYEEAFPRKV